MQKIFNAEDLQDLNARTLEKDFNRICTRCPHKDLYQIMQGHREDVSRTSSRASHKDLYKIMQRPSTAFHEDLHRIFTQGILKDLEQDLMPGPLSESRKTVIEGPLMLRECIVQDLDTRASHKSCHTSTSHL